MIIAILLYGYEIRGFEVSESIEMCVQDNFCKKFLKLPRNTFHEIAR